MEYEFTLWMDSNGAWWWKLGRTDKTGPFGSLMECFRSIEKFVADGA